jgi:hypothetical protein
MECNKNMSAIEKDYQTCLPPEAYIRICKAANNDAPPKFKSSVYPQKPQTKKPKNK